MDKDFKIIVTKGTGPGGQHKNKTESCVTVVHIPTGISETCQETRSKLRNLKLAKSRVIKRLDELQKEQLHEAQNKLRKEKLQKRVRTYNYKTRRVIDHRTKKQADLDKIMNGELDLLK